MIIIKYIKILLWNNNEEGCYSAVHEAVCKTYGSLKNETLL